MAITDTQRASVEVDKLIEARLAAFSERVHRRHRDAAAKIEQAKAAASLAQAAVDAAEREAAEIAIELERLIGPDAEASVIPAAAKPPPAKIKGSAKAEAKSAFNTGRSLDPIDYGGVAERKARWANRRSNYARRAFDKYRRVLEQERHRPRDKIDDLITLAMDKSQLAFDRLQAMERATLAMHSANVTDDQAIVIAAWRLRSMTTEPNAKAIETDLEADWGRRRQSDAQAAFKSYQRSLVRRRGEPSELDDLIHQAMAPSRSARRVTEFMHDARDRLDQADEKQAAVINAWGIE